MRRSDHSHLQHSHDFAADFSTAERRTRIVIVITAAMMILEIIAGWLSNSMALLADGWHMGTHVTAFFISAVAYYFSRRHSSTPIFAVPKLCKGSLEWRRLK